MTTADTADTVLIIEDDVVLGQAFAKALAVGGYHVRTAASAEEGLREIERCHPDAILLDFRMPLINGLGFLYRLRTQGAHCQIPSWS